MEIASGAAARAAVLVFFVLSGLLITRSIVGNIRRNSAFDLTDYLTSRAARIYPPFVFALLVTVSVVAIVKYFNLPGGSSSLGELRPGGLSFELKELWRSLLLYDGMTGVNGPLWTLYIEVKLYILAMGIALVVAGRSPGYRSIGTIVCILSVVLGWHDYGFCFFALIWLFGASLSVPILGERLPVLIASGVLTIAGAAILAPPWPGSWLDGTRVAMALQGAFCVAFAFAWLLPGWAERPWPKSALATADYSYTLYVVHFPLLALGYSLSLAAGLTSPLGLVGSLIVTAIVALAIVMSVAPMVENSKFFKRAFTRWRSA